MQPLRTSECAILDGVGEKGISDIILPLVDMIQDTRGQSSNTADEGRVGANCVVYVTTLAEYSTIIQLLHTSANITAKSTHYLCALQKFRFVDREH